MKSQCVVIINGHCRKMLFTEYHLCSHFELQGRRLPICFNNWWLTRKPYSVQSEAFFITVGWKLGITNSFVRAKKTALNLSTEGFLTPKSNTNLSDRRRVDGKNTFFMRSNSLNPQHFIKTVSLSALSVSGGGRGFKCSHASCIISCRLHIVTIVLPGLLTTRWVFWVWLIT